MKSLGVNEEALLAGFIPEIYATDRALELVASGMPFRDAYRRVAADLENLEGMDPHEAIRKKTHSGTTGNLRLEMAEERVAQRGRLLGEEMRSVESRVRELTGLTVSL
jgi:argininosuccinate lyase